MPLAYRVLKFPVSMFRTVETYYVYIYGVSQMFHQVGPLYHLDEVKSTVESFGLVYSGLSGGLSNLNKGV